MNALLEVAPMMRMVAGLPGLQGSTGISNTAGLAHDAQRYTDEF
jgi:hypothetical protein